jgi:hypothetical protein
MGSACGTQRRKVYYTLIAKPEGKSPLGRPKDRSKNVNKVVLRHNARRKLQWKHLLQAGTGVRLL